MQPPIIWTSAYILACRAGTTSRYSTGGTPSKKADQAGLCSHLGFTWQRGNISTRIWTRALQPVQEEVSSWRFCQAQTLSGPPNFSRSADISPGAEILMPAKIPLSAYISVRRQHFTHPPTFCASANIFIRRQYFGIRQYFHETPIFWNPPKFSWDANILESANIFMRRQYFWNPPIFVWPWIIYEFAWFLLLQIFVYILSLCI